MTSTSAAAPLKFGRFELQAHERRLLVDGQPATLGARAFDLLLAMAERAGRLVDKATLMDLVWPDVVVLENNLAVQMSALRRLLGADVIATIPGRGYRFVARLDEARVAPAAAHDPAASALAVQAGSDAPAVAAAPAAPALREAALRTNLPGELPALLGREAAIAELASLIERHRLVSVVGAGGIGKSLLTQHVLDAKRAAYPHGVCWVELGQLGDAEGLPGAVAAALGVHGGQGEASAALAAAVSSLTMLLALDNAEHLLEPVAALSRMLLDAAPGLRIVVTSQAALRLPIERVLRIGPLAVPEADASAAQAQRFGAVALFEDRARAVDRHFRVDDTNVRAIVETCRALDGVPLAIELAAARAPFLGAARLLASMQDRFSLLTQRRNRAAPERQRTLRAALEWSHELLAPSERQVFRRLGVIAGSASLPFVQQLVADADDDPPADPWAALDALDALADRSLVAVATPLDESEPRYRLLETPRAFALECLERAGERAAWRRRHALAVAALFDATYDELFGGRVGVDAWLRQREFDLDNARDALRWAREAGDAEVELRIASTLLRALPPTLHVERMALADACEARITPSVPEALQMKAWLELSCVLADPQKARGRHAAEQALAIARRLDAVRPDGADRFVLYHALSRAASAAAQADDVPAATRQLDELQRLEDPAWPAHRRLWGAEAAQWVARMSGDVAQALVLGRRLLALDRERGSHASIALGNLIDAELGGGHARASAQLGRQLVDSLRGTRHEYSLAFARINLLAALLAEDDVAEARPVAEAAWAKAAPFLLQHAAAAYLALLAALQGRPRAAVRLAAYSEAIYAARQEARERNETDATTRALALARCHLDEAQVAHLTAEGRALRDAEVAAVAFGADDEG